MSSWPASAAADVSGAGNLLAAARRGAGLTQAQLARRLAVSQATVARLERPQSNPRLATLDRALRAVGAQLVLAASPTGAGVDESLIRQQLELPVSERLRRLESMYEQARLLQGARSADGEPA
jgi:transcriptional regulator with XRE-family HTH domain